MNNLEAPSRILQEVCDNIKTAIEQGRTDVIKSVLEACKTILQVFVFLCIAATILIVVQI
jgi:hypothetical protein